MKILEQNMKSLDINSSFKTSYIQQISLRFYCDKNCDLINKCLNAYNELTN